MSGITRYIPIKAIKGSGDELIPFFDPRLIFDNDGYGSNHIRIKDSYNKVYSFVDCIYDMKSGKILPGIEKEYYPKDTEYKIGESVLYEVKMNHLQQTIIIDIIYEEFEVEYRKGKKIDAYQKSMFFPNGEDILADSIYALKTWIPTYKLSNGKSTKWTHQLNHIYQE